LARCAERVKEMEALEKSERHQCENINVLTIIYLTRTSGISGKPSKPPHASITPTLEAKRTLLVVRCGSCPSLEYYLVSQQTVNRGKPEPERNAGGTTETSRREDTDTRFLCWTGDLGNGFQCST
jgi:hypothetical protein